MSEVREVTTRLIGALLFVCVMVGVGYVVDRHQCHMRWTQSHHESQYGLFVGCLVKSEKDGWIPEHNYRSIE